MHTLLFIPLCTPSEIDVQNLDDGSLKKLTNYLDLFLLRSLANFLSHFSKLI